MKNYHFHKCIYEGKLRKEPLKQEKWDPLMIGYSVIVLLAVVLVIIVAIIFNFWNRMRRIWRLLEWPKDLKIVTSI